MAAIWRNYKPFETTASTWNAGQAAVPVPTGENPGNPKHWNSDTGKKMMMMIAFNISLRVDVVERGGYWFLLRFFFFFRHALSSTLCNGRPAKTTNPREMVDTSFWRYEQPLTNEQAEFTIFPKTWPLEALMSRTYNERHEILSLSRWWTAVYADCLEVA